MHLHFPFTTLTILWTLTFAAHLVLLVVLLGRDRIKRFPLFSLSIGLTALRLLGSHLLTGRIPQMTMAEIFIAFADLTAFVNLLVLVEVARKAFGRVQRSRWVAGSLAAMIVGAVVLKFAGPWPDWKMLLASPPLQVMQFVAQKGMQLADIEAILVGLLIIVLGRRCGAGFRSHVQQIAIGLMTAAIAELSVEKIWEAIARTVVVHSVEERNHVLSIRDHLFNTNSVVYVLVLVWWIVCLWRDENGKDQRSGTGNQVEGVQEITASEVDQELL